MAETREPAAPAASTNTVRRGRRTLILLALVALAPIVASYAAYYLFRHEARLNYGTLLPTAPAPVWIPRRHVLPEKQGTACTCLWAQQRWPYVRRASPGQILCYSRYIRSA